MATSPAFQSLKTSSEYLSQVRPWPPGRELLPFGSRSHPVSLKQLQLLLTQSVYLVFYLYSALPHANCFLSRKLWAESNGEEEEGLVLILVTQEQAQGKEQQALTRFVEQECIAVAGTDEQQAIAAIRNCIEACLECFKESLAKGLILPTRLNETIIKAEMEEFCYVYHSVLSPKLALALFSPDSLLRALEETRLFRENALLLKYSNNSLLARTLPEKCREDLIRLTEGFEAERKLLLKDKGRVALSEDLVEKFLFALSFSNVIALIASSDSSEAKAQMQEPKASKGKFGKVVNKQKDSRTAVFNFNITEVNYQFLTPQRLDYLLAHPGLDRLPFEKPSPNKRVNEFELSYSALANQLELKLLTGYPVRPQEIDLTAAVLASLSGALPEVDYSFEEPRIAKNNNEKVVALRTRTQLHPKECPFSCLLESVDRLIADSLVIEYDLRVKRVAGERRREQIAETGQYLLERVRNLLGVFWGEGTL